MKAYKVFNSDWTCYGFQFEVGKEYKLDVNPIFCEVGFHFCQNPANCFKYYDFDPKNHVAEIEVLGIIVGTPEEKECSNHIKVVREITWLEVLQLVNTGANNTGLGNSGYSNSGDRNSGYRNSGYSNSGNRNSGYSNSGDRNSGYRNSGYSNSGNRNSGYSNSGDKNSGDSNSGNRNSGNSNSGDFNACDFETGFFNSIQADVVRVFNKLCKSTVWENCNKPDFIYFNLCQWVSFNDMSDEEKTQYPKAFVCDGYLKTFDYKEAWQNSFKNASEYDIALLKALPNFDAAVFFEITGIKIE